VDTSYYRFVTIHAFVRRTDRHTDRRALAILCVALGLHQGRIQDFGMGAQVERRKREYRGAVGAEGVRFGEGVSPSPMGVGSGEGAVPPQAENSAC